MKLVDEEFTYLKCRLFVEEGKFINNFKNVGKDNVVSPPQNLEHNLLPPAMDDICEQDNSVSVIQVESIEMEVHIHIQLRLEKLNDLYEELGRDYFTTERIKNIGLEHIENAIRRLNELNRELQFAFNPQLVPRRIYLLRAGSIIASVQANVSRTRFGHGRPWNPKNKDVVGSSGDTNPSQASGIYNLIICNIVEI